MPALPRIFLCDLTYTQQTISSDIMPAAVGLLGAFVQQQMPGQFEVVIHKYPEQLIADLNAMTADTAPKVVGFANYVWNCNLSVAFAEIFKRDFPETVIVFGGPNLPIDRGEQEDFLKRFPVIDFHVVKEGEVAFLKLVQVLQAANWQRASVNEIEVPNLIFHDAAGAFHASPKIERVPFEQLTSPYLAGLMDPFFDGKLLPIVQTNRGCPFTCTFCTEGMMYWTKVKKAPRERVDEELEYIARKVHALGGKARADLHIADSNFGMYPQDVDTAKTLARTRKDYGYPQYINVATGKNQKERVLEVARLLDGALKLSGTVQSLNTGVLENIKRGNISVEGLMNLATDAEMVGANSFSEVILALPGDSRAAHFETVKTLVEAGFNNVTMYQLMILPGTEMGSLAQRQQYEMRTRYRLLPRCYGFFDVRGHQINVAEMEEICVANNTLSHEEYFQCRKLNLIVNVFYNDGVFKELLKFLRLLKVSIWDWLKLINDEFASDGDFGHLMSEFLRETHDELWDHASDLEAFYRQRDNLKKYIAGEIGGNLMFKYKGLSMTQYLGAVATLAEQATLTLLRRQGLVAPEVQRFAHEIVRFNQVRMQDLFVPAPAAASADFDFDIAAFAQAKEVSQLGEFAFPARTTVRFEFDEEQLRQLTSYREIFGNSATGISRTLSRVYIRKLLRHPRGPHAVAKSQPALAAATP